MKVQDLIELLEDCDPEAEVRLADQPSWPLAFELRRVAVPDDAGYEGGHTDDSPYAPNYLWDIARVA